MTIQSKWARFDQHLRLAVYKPKIQRVAQAWMFCGPCFGRLGRTSTQSALWIFGASSCCRNSLFQATVQPLSFGASVSCMSEVDSYFRKIEKVNRSSCSRSRCLRPSWSGSGWPAPIRKGKGRGTGCLHGRSHKVKIICIAVQVACVAPVQPRHRNLFDRIGHSGRTMRCECFMPTMCQSNHQFSKT